MWWVGFGWFYGFFWIAGLLVVFALVRRFLWGPSYWGYGPRAYRRWGGYPGYGPGPWNGSGSSGSRWEDILKERLARGEIDQAEYERLTDLLKK